jgi:hypothetical protein
MPVFRLDRIYARGLKSSMRAYYATPGAQDVHHAALAATFR